MKNTRRNFLKQSALLGAGFVIVPRRVLGGPGYIAPSDEITLGFIGVGLRGQSHISLALNRDDCNVVAINDIDVTSQDRLAQWFFGPGEDRLFCRKGLV